MRNAWDIFCRVVDNFGDIGIAWRLARQLASEHGVSVTLWVDDLTVFRMLRPQIMPEADCQQSAGVEVRAWREPLGDARPGSVVIEAFGCALPESYLVAMAEGIPAPVWINLEYLSAETWVRSHHGLPSPHPRFLLTKHFFFPGYEAGTGGLLCERDLACRREAFLHGRASALWQALAIPPPASTTLCVSLFAYENPALPALLFAWAAGDQPVRCLVPQGKLVPSLAAWTGEPTLAAGSVVQRGNLTVNILPFLAQDDYDTLLWVCDVNFVRGEDSCVRAQWARRLFVWQAYPQEGNAHRAKLDALLHLYVGGLPAAEALAVKTMWHSWNGRDQDIGRAWKDFMVHRPALMRHADAWADTLTQAGDLAGNLMRFVEHRVSGLK